MDFSGIQTRSRSVEGLIEAGRLKEAMSGLTLLLQEIGFGPLYDELRQQEVTYRYLLQYHLDGYADNDREKVLNEIRRKLCSLTDRAALEWMHRHACGWLFTQLRRHPEVDFLPTARALRDARDDGRSAQDEATEQACRRRCEELQIKLFEEVLRPDAWKDEDAWEEGFALCDNDTQALLTAALLLSLQICFDRRKLMMLMDLAAHASMTTSMRALTALALAVDRHRLRISLDAELSARLKLLTDDAWMASQLPVICGAVIRERNADDLTHRMQQTILPEMNRFGHLLKEKMDKPDKSESELDMEELLSDTRLTDRMMKFQQMQTEGEDVYLATFEWQKGDLFFSDVSNWFLPYDERHTLLTDAPASSGEGKSLSLKKLIAAMTGLCDSDKYSLCRSLSRIGGNAPDMFIHPGTTDEALDEAVSELKEANRHRQAFLVINEFVQDLYRFFKLCPRRQEFGDVFALSPRFDSHPLLSAAFDTPECLVEMAALHIRHPHYILERRQDNCREALRLLDKAAGFTENDFNALRLRGYCHEQLNELPAALEDYRKADVLRADNRWVLRHWATCCDGLGQPREACTIWQRLAALDKGNLQYQLNVGHMYMAQKRWSEALNAYYKAEFLFPDAEKTRRPLAWCSTLLGRFDQAEEYTQKILRQNPTANDWLNAGHLAWLRGQLREAVTRYAQGAALMADRDGFLSLFDRDLPLLQEAGLDESEIPMMRDSLLDALEP